MRKLTIYYFINFYLLSLCVKFYVLSLYLSLLRWFRLSYSQPFSSSSSFLFCLCFAFFQFVNLSLFLVFLTTFLLSRPLRGGGGWYLTNKNLFPKLWFRPSLYSHSLSTRKAIKWNTFHFNSNSAYIFLAPEVVTVKNPNPVGFMP